MEFAKGLTPHTILILVDKAEKAVAMAALFKSLKHKIVTALSLYEALKIVDQEMPHLVICDALIADGTAGNLFDRMHNQVVLKDIPILVLIAAKTKEQLEPLKGRKFAGFLLGKYDGNMLLLKAKEILEGHGDVSPFFVSSEQCHLPEHCTLAMKAKVLGRVGDQMVCQSEAEIDRDSSLLCQPIDKSKGPALLKFGSNVHKSGTLYNMFPMNMARGSGKLWISQLPEISLENLDGASSMKRVVFFDPKPQRFEQFQKILSGYNIELVYANNLSAATSIMVRDSDGSLGCVYLDELPANASGIALKEVVTKINERTRPVVVAGTNSLNSKDTKDIRFIKKPFGIGMLVETLDQAIKSKQNFSGAANLNLDIQYQTPAQLLGLDETGGIIQLKFPVPLGSKFILQHDKIVEMWGGACEIRIISVVKLMGAVNIWQAKFENISSQGNKSRYWDRLSKKISERMMNLSA